MKKFKFGLIALVVVAALICVINPAAAADKPNIVVISGE